MKKERSFQRKLLPIILLLAAVPLFLFSILALVSLRSILIDRYQDQVDSDLDQTEKLLNITLDRYRDALVAAGTDEKFCLAVQKVLEGQEPEAESRGEVEELLGRICRQSTEAAGMTLVLENGDSFYYDVSAASGPEGGWRKLWRPVRAGRRIQTPLSAVRCRMRYRLAQGVFISLVFSAVLCLL